jgi:hypothetical protein
VENSLRKRLYNCLLADNKMNDSSLIKKCASEYVLIASIDLNGGLSALI